MEYFKKALNKIKGKLTIKVTREDEMTREYSAYDGNLPLIGNLLVNPYKTLEFEGKTYYEIQIIRIRKEFRGQGYASRVYQNVLDELDELEGVGLYSRPDLVSNKTLIPKVHNKLNTKTDDQGIVYISK